jgi:hypothetical protein
MTDHRSAFLASSWRKPATIDLTQLTIACADGPPVEQEDHSTAKTAVDIEVVFRRHRDRLLTLLAEYPYALGCIAWLSDMHILDALATRQGVSILVQKEDFLRPDLDTASDFALILRRAYERIPTLSRYWAPGIASSLSVCCDDSAGPVRCVGNDNADKHPAWPRMHNKFLVFCSLRENAWRGPELHPECVWTGSYNITFNAQKSFENAVILRDPDVAGAYAREWAQILALSEPLDWEDRWCAPEYRIGT